MMGDGSLPKRYPYKISKACHDKCKILYLTKSSTKENIEIVDSCKEERESGAAKSRLRRRVRDGSGSPGM